MMVATVLLGVPEPCTVNPKPRATKANVVSHQNNGQPIAAEIRLPTIDGLRSHHVADLIGSGLTAETIQAARLHTVDDPAEIGEILNWSRPITKLGAALAFPFVDIVTGEFGSFARLKPDRPRSKNGRARKYEQPAGLGNRIYAPRLAWEALQQPREMIGIVEGEKKSLAACQSQLAAVSVSGVWGWTKKRQRNDKGHATGERQLIDDLDCMDWQSRPVWIGFDFDETRKPTVNHAAAELARVLHERGAIVTIVQLPPGPRQPCGRLSKMAVDDYMLANGPEALRKLVTDQAMPATRRRTLTEWRGQLAAERIDSLTHHEVNLCRSPTGSGKSFADTLAMKLVDRSLVVLPTHKNCREFETTCESVNLRAVAYPEMSKQTCENYTKAEKALSHGLSPSQAICPTCEYREACEYRQQLEVAERAAHKICTHHRGSMSFEKLSAGQEFISVHEDAAEFLRPGIQISQGLEQVRDIADAVVADIRSRYFGGDRDQSEEYFFHLMSEIAGELSVAIRSDATRQIRLPVAATMQRGCDGRLWAAMLKTDTWPPGDAMQLVRSLANGEIVELVVRVDRVLKPSGEVKRIHKSICGVRQTEVPADAPVWLADATADAADIASLIGDRRLRDRTPDGELTQLHATLQIPTDVKRSTSPAKVAGIVRALLPKIAWKQIGVICHRDHVATVTEAGSGRIVRAEHFFGGASRGSNEWIAECDGLIVLGTPRVPPEVIRDRLLKLGLIAAMARDESETDWNLDYWPAFTTDGRRMTIRTLAYADHDWHRAHCQIVQSELRQAIGRGRAVSENGIPVLVLTTENLGLKILDIDGDPLTKSQKKVLDALKKLMREKKENIPEAQKLTEHFPTGKLTEHFSTLYIGKCSVSSADIAAEISSTDRHARKILCELESKNFAFRIGSRGGWLLGTPDQIDIPAGGRTTGSRAEVEA